MDFNATSSSPTRIPPPRGYALSGKLMLSAIVILFSIVLLLLFIHLYVRWHLNCRASLHRRRRRRRRSLHFAAADQSPSGTAIPSGLDPKILGSLAVSIFSSSDDDDVAECAVCLSEFEEGEKVRILSRCDHRFHIDCIDMWFGSHNSCPLCRSAVEIEAAAAAGRCADRSIEGWSVSGEVRIEIRREEEEELGFGFGFGSNRMLAIKRFLRLCRGEIDIERGEVEERAAPPPVVN